MNIVITHLTRMAKGFCCAAGIDPETGQCIRAVQRPYSGIDPRLTTSSLWLSGGPFKIGNVVDLGKTIPHSTPPETEDHWINPANAKVVFEYSPLQFWSLISTRFKQHLSDVFGVTPIRNRASIFIPAGQGTASLGFIQLRVFSKLSVSKGIDEKKIRLVGKFDNEWSNLSVTDIRFFNADCITPDEEKVESTARRLSKEAKMGRVILGLGLTRPFSEHSNTEAVHWVQVTGIHIR